MTGRRYTHPGAASFAHSFVQREVLAAWVPNGRSPARRFEHLVLTFASHVPVLVAGVMPEGFVHATSYPSFEEAVEHHAAYRSWSGEPELAVDETLSGLLSGQRLLDVRVGYFEPVEIVQGKDFIIVRTSQVAHVSLGFERCGILLCAKPLVGWAVSGV